MNDPLLSIRDLAVQFKTDLGVVNALNGVSFDLPRNCITAIVGESGSGKSVTVNSIMRLLPDTARTSGSITLYPQGDASVQISSLDAHDRKLQNLRGGLVSMVFQEPMTALSPVHRVGDQVAEAVLCHRDVSRKQAMAEAATMLTRVGIPDAENRMQMYPFEFSGGMRQRVVIAMALICNPLLLLCDEPTTALDVTTQAEILVLIRSLQQQLRNSVLFITHDIGVVAQIADQVIVMYNGQIVEVGSVREVLKTPMHAYTRHLLAAMPGIQVQGLDQRRLTDWAQSAPVGRRTSLAGAAGGHQTREFDE